MLDHVQRVLQRDRELAAQLRYRVPTAPTFDPGPLVAGGIRYLERRFAETEALLREIVRTRDTLFAVHKLSVRGVARLQNSYMRFDLLHRDWKALQERLDRGELAEWEERHARFREVIVDAEDSVRPAGTGIPLVAPLREYAHQQGPVCWHFP